MAFVAPEHVSTVLTAIVLVQRDFGDRTDRKQARLKYLVHRWGVPRVKAKVEEYLTMAEEICGVAKGSTPRPLADPDPADVTTFCDHLGWHEQGDGKWFLGLPIENGRVKDDDSVRLKTALRQVFSEYCSNARLTAQQNLLLCDLLPESRPIIEKILAEHGVPMVEQLSNLRRFAFACPALPTCGLAITESERAMPAILGDLEQLLNRLCLDDARFALHTTGCPNGCSRPYNCDIGIVGRTLDGKTGEGKYTIFLGGNMQGTRMNTVYQDLVPASEIAAILEPVLVAYKAGRRQHETLGDFCHRVGVEKLPKADLSPVM
jgi:sulfite reductase (ferredoxin)